MRMILPVLVTKGLSVLVVALGAGQHHPPVSWHCQWSATAAREGTIMITGNLAPGWHVYSQHLPGDGPIPTQLNYTQTADFERIGAAHEKGSPFTYYDSLYEMNITWYAYELKLLQKIRLKNSSTTINGEIVCMVCNATQCIPLKETFTIPVVDKQESP